MYAEAFEVDDAHFRNERAVEIAAPPDEVWPWLAQMGFGRAGWYSWDLIDNLGRPSAIELHPEWMVQAVGDPMPGGPIEFDTAVVDPPNQLVITFGPRSFGPWRLHFALCYRLVDTRPGCRLIAVATARIDGPLGGPFARCLLGPGDAFMVRKQLAGIRERCEPAPLMPRQPNPAGTRPAE